MALSHIRKAFGAICERASRGWFFSTRQKCVHKLTAEELLDKYKKILSAIMPSEMLTQDGFLKTPTGEGERINISTVGEQAYYKGALPFKVMRHRVDRAKALLPEEQYAVLQECVAANILFEMYDEDDTIEIGGGKHKSVLVHETFHDIQGYLYDYHPSVMEKLFAAIHKHKDSIHKWYANPDNKKWTGPGNYQLTDILPTAGSTLVGAELSGLFLKQLMRKMGERNVEVHKVAIETVQQGGLDLARSEAIPVLLGAASEGNAEAAAIVKSIFADAGLKDIPAAV
jgi:hypothetical protein